MTLLPPNASAMEKAIEAAVQEPALPVPLRDVWSPQSCPPALLPWLAWGLSIDNWNANWPLSVQRAMVANAIALQRRKGTVEAVRRAVAAFGGSISLREWWQMEPRGTPHTFSLVLSITTLDGASPTADYVDAIIAEIYRAKAARSHFDFTLAVDAAASIGLIAAVRPTTYARLTFDA